MAVRLSGSIISKEGFLYKKGGIIKSWSRRYFVLSPQSLCYFRSESHEQLEPLGRIFLSDIVSISTESTEKKKAFVFVLHTKKRAVLLQGANNEDRDKWVESIKKAAEIDKEAESQDPFRKSLRRLTPGIKRITLFKDPSRGIGCTIKNAAGHIFVNRILEDGPIAETGVLRPGDEILDIHGEPVANKSVAQVVEIIKQCPTEFLATVRPITSNARRPDNNRIDYSHVIHKPKRTPPTVNGNTDKLYESVEDLDSDISSTDSYDYATVQDSSSTLIGRLESPHEESSTPPRSSQQSPPSFESQPSFEDVGNYDDEDEGDVPPPLPEWTEDALIMVDPPPTPTERKFNIYNTNAHLLPPIKNGKKYPGTPPTRRSPAIPTQYSPRPRRKPPVKQRKNSPQEVITNGNCSSSSNDSSPVISRRLPPNFPPPRPGKLLKSYSQDALDQIETKPPVPPRIKRQDHPYRSPGARPRNGHTQKNGISNGTHKRDSDGVYDDVTYNRRTPVRSRNHQYEDIDTPTSDVKQGNLDYADLAFTQSYVYTGR